MKPHGGIILGRHNGKILIDRSGEHVLVIGPTRCVDAETEYLSPTGWKPISLYDGGAVMQWSLDNGGFWAEPESFIKTPASRFLRFKTGHGIDQMLTPDHRMLYRTSKGNLCVRTAQQIADQHNSSRRGWEGLTLTTFSSAGGAGLDMTDEQIRVQVAFMADGYLNPRARQGRIRIKKERKVSRLRQLLTAAGIDHTEYEELDYVDRERKPYRTFLFVPPRREKSFGAEWWQATPEQLAVIADEVMHWDGTVSGKTFHSNDRPTIDFIQYALTTNGKRASVFEGKGDRAGQFTLCVTNRTEVSMAVGDPTTKRQIEEEKSVDGFAYCFKTLTGFWVARRGGNIFVTGNCGKGISIIRTTLLDGWYGAAVIHDPKGELWDETAWKRSQHGHCLKFDPSDKASVRINLFDLVDPGTDIADVQNFVEVLTDGLPANHWTMAAQELLTAGWLHLLHHAPVEDKCFGGLRRLIQKGDLGLAEIVIARANAVAVRIAQSLLNRDNFTDENGKHELSTEEEKSNYRQSVFASAGVLLKVFDDPVLDYLTSATELSFSQLVCSDYPVSLYLSIKDDDAPRVRPYVKAMVVGIRRTLMRYEKTDRYGELKRHRLLFCMDEYLDFKIKDMTEAMTKAAGAEMTMLLVAQGFELIENQEADKGAGIRKNASTWVMYKPNDDTEAYRIEKMLGKVTVMEEQESHSGDRMALSLTRKSVSYREVEKTILPMAELLKWPKRKWAIVMGHGKPIKAEVIHSHMERRFASKMKPPPTMRDRDGNLLDRPHDRFVSPWKDKVGTPVVIERKPKEPKEKKAVAATKKPADPIKQAAEKGTIPMVIK